MALDSNLALPVKCPANELGPLLTRVLEPPLGALVSWIGATGRLAHANSRTSVRRVASVASALMLTTTMACTVLLVTGSLNRITAEQTDRRTRADVVLLPRDAPGLPPDVAAAARRLPGAEAVAATRSTTFVSYVLGTPDVLGAQALDPAAAAKVLDLGLREGALTSLAKDGTVAVSRTHAKEHSLHVGDRLRGWLGDGTKVSLTVGAVFDRPLGLGDILLSERYLASHMHQKLDDSVLVRAKSGEEKRLREAAAALVRDHPTAKVTDVGEYASATRTALAQNTTGTYLVLSVLVMFTGVSVVNGLLMGTAERAREFALLRLLGASRGTNQPHALSGDLHRGPHRRRGRHGHRLRGSRGGQRGAHRLHGIQHSSRGIRPGAHGRRRTGPGLHGTSGRACPAQSGGRRPSGGLTPISTAH